METYTITFNDITYNIPIILAISWCNVLSEVEQQNIHL